MADGGGCRWQDDMEPNVRHRRWQQDDMEPNVRPVVRHLMVMTTQPVELLGADRCVDLERLRPSSAAAGVEEAAFTATSAAAAAAEEEEQHHARLARCNPACVAQLQGQQQQQPAVGPDAAQPDHLLSRNGAGGVFGTQQQQQQQVLEMRTGMEPRVLTTPACGQVAVNQQGDACHRPSLQTTETTNEAVDWREEMFQRIESWRAAYFSQLMELSQFQISVIPKITEEQLQSLPKHKAEAYKRLSLVKDATTTVLNFLHLQKSDIPETYREKLPMYEAAIHKLLDHHRKTKAFIKGRKEPQDHHRNPQTVDLAGGTAPFNGWKSSQQNQPEQLADASISRTRQNVATTTPPAHQETDSSDPQGEIKSPCFSVRSPGGLQSSSQTIDVGACCAPSRPCAPVKSSLTSTADKSTILAAGSPCSSVKSTLLSDDAKSGMTSTAASPCESLKSTAPDDINSCHQVTPCKMTLLPASLVPAQTAANGTEDEAVRCTVETPTPAVKKPMDRLLDAVRASSPAVLHSSAHDIKSALVTMDSVPLPPRTRSGSNNKMKRAYDVIASSCSESPAVGSLDGAKRQKTQNAKEVLLHEIEAINSQLVDTTLVIVGDDSPADGVTSCNGGTLIRLLYTGASLAAPAGMESRPLISSGTQPLVMPVALLVAADYPASSPTVVCDEEDERLIRRIPSSVAEEVDAAAFRRALRVLPEPRSLKETAGAWDACVRRAVADFARRRRQHAGGAIGWRPGRWESCVGA